MTDNEIINQWKHEREFAECVCSYFVDQVELSLINETINLINRQKEEIEALVAGQETLQKYIEKVRSEAYKEFVERVKEASCKLAMCNNGIPISTSYQISSEELNKILKEMVEKNK